MTAFSMTHQLADSWTLHVNVQALTLADKRATVSREFKNLFLTDFPDCLINRLNVGRNIGNVLNRP